MSAGHFSTYGTLTISHHLEFLHSMSRFVPHTNLGNINVTLGIDGHGVAMRKFSGLVTWSAESRQNFAAGVIENVHLFVLFIQYEHEPLRLIGRKADKPSRTPRARHVSRSGRLSSFSVIDSERVLRLVRDKYVFFEVSHLIEHLHPVATPVAHIH